MPLYFLNGGAPNYTGQLFTTSNSLLIHIRDTLISAGWVVINDSIPVSIIMSADGLNSSDPLNPDKCFLSFTISEWSGVLNGKKLDVVGDITGDFNDTSTTFDHYFISDADNILYITADDDSGCLYLESFDGVSSNLHFGFLDRYHADSDTYGWMIGRIDWRINNSYWAKSYRTQTSWYPVGSDYYMKDNIDSSKNAGAYQGTMDRYTVFWNFSDSNNYFHNDGSGWGWERDSSVNSSYYCHKGGVNPITNLPILGEFYYLEGRGETGYGNSLGNNIPPSLFYRGSVKHAVIGVGALSKKAQVTDNEGKRYLSAGGAESQGFRIL